MSLEKEDQQIMDQLAEMNYESQKKLKITYTRDFLLSLSELDVCGKLPSGFDKLLLSQFEDAPQDRPKVSGSLSLHSYRRNEYGSSPPTRDDLGNYSRGIHGRWDSRFSGRNDRDSDSQSDWDSDSGRYYGNQSRRSWQGPEHDGLLGSGSFSRPSGYAAGAPASKFRANDHCQPNKSNEPYHSPRPYKAVPHSRRETNDSFNEETFGSSECTSKDRAEEERKRRASFELMRKEQHKAFQEKQRLNSDKRKDEFDISTLLEDSKDDDGISSKSKQFDEPVMLPATNKDSDKSALASQTPASRPLVPPGFASAPLERNIGAKNTTHCHSLEVGNYELDSGVLHANGNRLLNGRLQEEESAEQIGLSRLLESNIHVFANNRSHEVQNLSSDLQVSNKTIVQDGELYKGSNFLKSFEASKKTEGLELDTEKVTDNKTVGESNLEKSSSILDKLFGSVSTVCGGGSNSLVEQPDSKADDMWSPDTVHSSKFAHWFLEEERKPVDELSSGRPKDLLSLIVGGEIVGSQPSDVKATGYISFGFPSQSPEITDMHLASNATSVPLENSEQFSDINISNPASAPAVLTCEDLELSILSEITGSDETLRPPVQGLSVTDSKAEQIKANIDDHASHHLLSLLQKGMGLEDVKQSPSLDIIASGKPRNVEVASIHSAVHDPRETNAENVTNSGKSLTLETLFGTAFMKELQSVGAPSSAQKSSIGPARVDTSELHDGLLSSNLETGSGRMSYESRILASNQPERIKSDGIKEHLLGFDEHRTEADSSQLQNELESKLGSFDRSADARLPEEDSLIALSDPMKHLRNSTTGELFSSKAAPVDITENLAGLNSVFGDERPIAGGQEGSPFVCGPFGVREHDLSFHNLHVQPSSPQLHPQLNHVGQLFNPLDSHPANINSPMKFVGPESIIHRDPPPAHQFPASIPRHPFHHPSSGPAGFDPPTHHHPIPRLQQMYLQGNFPPPHLLSGFPGASNSNNQMAGASNSNNQMAGFIQDVNPMPGFPFGHRQPNFNGLPMPPLVPEVESGKNNPEMLQRLIEMELRSNAKQIHPLATVDHNQGMHNFELDTGFGYR